MIVTSIVAMFYRVKYPKKAPKQSWNELDSLRLKPVKYEKSRKIGRGDSDDTTQGKKNHKEISTDILLFFSLPASVIKRLLKKTCVSKNSLERVSARKHYPSVKPKKHTDEAINEKTGRRRRKGVVDRPQSYIVAVKGINDLNMGKN